MSPEFNPGSGRPLTPEEIQARKQDGIPSEVFDAFPHSPYLRICLTRKSVFLSHIFTT